MRANRIPGLLVRIIQASLWSQSGFTYLDS